MTFNVIMGRFYKKELPKLNTTCFQKQVEGFVLKDFKNVYLKTKQNEETENFINKWQKEESLCNVCSPTYKNKNIRHKSIKSLLHMPREGLWSNQGFVQVDLFF